MSVVAKPRLSSRSFWLLLAPATAISIVWIAGAIIGWGPTDSEGIPLMAAALAYVVLGTVILGPLPRHRIGWLFVLTGYSLILSGLSAILLNQGLVVGNALGGGLWLSWLCLGGFVMLWFPSGRPPSDRWHWVSVLGYGILTLSFFGYLFAGRLCVADIAAQDNGECSRFVANPIGISWVPNPEYSWVSGVGFAALFGFIVVSAVSLLVRVVLSRGVERKQLKWFLFAVALSVLNLLLSALGDMHLIPLMTPLLQDSLDGLTVVAVPSAAAIAILKYRLYEIDRIISRTLGYALVVGLLGLVYAVGAVWLPSRLTGDSPLFVAGSTLAVAALFNPVRRRVLRLVDRRFYRSRYDAVKVVEEFSSRLRRQTDMGVLTTDWLAVVVETMKPVSVGIWVKS